MPGDFRTGTGFPGTGDLSAAGTDQFNARVNDVDTITAEVVNSLANAVIKAQAAINDNQPMTAAGDLIVGGVTGDPQRLEVGPADGYALLISGGLPSWELIDTASDLQTAYETGSVVTTDSTNGDLIVKGDQQVIINTPDGLHLGPEGGSNKPTATNYILTVTDDGTFNPAIAMARIDGQGTNTTHGLEINGVINGLIITGVSNKGIDIDAGNDRPIEAQGGEASVFGQSSGNGAALRAQNTSNSNAESVLDIKDWDNGATISSLLRLEGTNGYTEFTIDFSSTNQITYKLPSAQATASGQALTNDGSGNLSWATVGGSLQVAYEAGNTITTDSTNGNVVVGGDQSLQISASGGLDLTNVLITTSIADQGISIVPNGTGALTVSTSGDPRGDSAIDLQVARSTTSQVASGIHSVVGGGQNNTASDNWTVVSGGVNNTASGSESYVGGGNGGTASGTRSTVGGGNGNTAGNSHSTVGGGRNNDASGISATISGGDGNTATFTESTVGGGALNSAETECVVSGGQNNTAGDRGSVVPGGIGNTTSHQGSIAMGFGAQTSAIFDLVLGNLNDLGATSSTSNVHFRIAGDTSDVHIGRQVDQTAVTGATNKLALHTILDSAQSRSVNIRAHDALTASYDLELPDAQATSSGRVLVNDGYGELSWESGGTSWAVQTANYNASPGDGVMADTSGGSFTVFLPVSPVEGDEVVVTDNAGTFGTNNLTVDGNGNNIFGNATLTMSTNYEAVSLVFSTSGGWIRGK